MTPPDVNQRRQWRRHKLVLWGIIAAIVLALLAWVAYRVYETPVEDEAATVEEPTVATDKDDATVATDEAEADE